MYVRACFHVCVLVKVFMHCVDVYACVYVYMYVGKDTDNRNSYQSPMFPPTILILEVLRNSTSWQLFPTWIDSEI